MLKYKIIVVALLICGFSSVAQLETNSPYSRFGLGNLVRPVSAFNTSMGGVATSLTSADDINTFNPALLYRTRKVTFEFGGAYNITTATQDQAINRSSEFKFDYLNLAFPVTPRYSLALGLKPYSRVSYRTESSTVLDNSTYVDNSYFGEGGINAVNFTNSYTILKDSVNRSVLSLGLDATLLIGNISRNATAVTFIDNEESAALTNYKTTSSYSGFRFKAGTSYRKELFKGKEEKIVESCESKDLKDTLMVSSFFYPNEIERVSETGYISDYVVVFPGSNRVIISSKIKSEARREQLAGYYSSMIKKGFGVFVLEDAVGVDYKTLKDSYLKSVKDINDGGTSRGVLSMDKIAKEYLRLKSGVNLTAGFAYELGSEIGLDQTTEVTRTSIATDVSGGSSTLDLYEDEKVRLPQSLHFGLSIDKEYANGRNYCGEKLKATWALGADVSLTNWSEYEAFDLTESFSNTLRVGLGGFYTPNRRASENDSEIGLVRLLLRTNYRAGVFYQTLPYSISGEQVTEIGTNVGFTFPTNRAGSSMTWTLGYSRRGTEIVENRFNVGVGLTILDRSNWFKRFELGL